MATLGWFCRKSETRNKSFFLFRHHHGNATPRRNHIPSTFGATNRDTQIQRQNERERERERKRMYFWFVLWRPFERMMTETFQFPVYFFIVLSLSLSISLSLFSARLSSCLFNNSIFPFLFHSLCLFQYKFQTIFYWETIFASFSEHRSLCLF